MAAARGLGKGLDIMLPDKIGNASTEGRKKPEIGKDVIFVKIGKIEPNRYQPRKKFDEDALIELSESLKQYGVLQPLLVQDKKEYYEIDRKSTRLNSSHIH